MTRKRPASKDALELRHDERGLALACGDVVVRGDFTRMLRRLKPGNVNRELVVRAARIRHVEGPLTAVDATAGLGEDALLLAAAGFYVRLYERNPTIAALLADAMARATQVPELASVIGKMKLVGSDSIEALPHLDERPDVVLLDPMFPARQKDAAVKKKLRLLQQVEGPCLDEKELFKAAISAHPRKIIVKRPAKGPHLAGQAPDYALAGKAIRFDCYVMPK